MRNLILAGVSAACLGLGAPSAQAASVSLSYDGVDVTPAARVDLFAPRALDNLPAGGFLMSDGDTQFLAWCIDLFDTIKSATYELVRPGQVSDAEEADLNRLFTNNRSVAQTNAVTAAAFQVAIWEIVYETAGSYDLASGAFRAGDNADVMAQAQDWLDTLGTGTGRYELTFYTSDRSQDLVTGSLAAVPLPAGGLLLVTSLGALGLARSRRQR